MQGCLVRACTCSTVATVMTDSPDSGRADAEREREAQGKAKCDCSSQPAAASLCDHRAGRGAGVVGGPKGSAKSKQGQGEVVVGQGEGEEEGRVQVVSGVRTSERPA